MRERLFPFTLGILLLTPLSAQAQVTGGVLGVTGAEMG